MALQTKTGILLPGTAKRQKKTTEQKKIVEQQRISEQKTVVTFTSGDGTVYEIPDLPENLGHATALAAEHALRKIWGTEQEAQTCQDMFGEKSF